MLRRIGLRRVSRRLIRRQAAMAEDCKLSADMVLRTVQTTFYQPKFFQHLTTSRASLYVWLSLPCDGDLVSLIAADIALKKSCNWRGEFVDWLGSPLSCSKWIELRCRSRDLYCGVGKKSLSLDVLSQLCRAASAFSTGLLNRIAVWCWTRWMVS